MKRTILVTLALPLLVLAACSNPPVSEVASASGAPVAPAAVEEGPEPSSDPQERGRQFAQCMRDHGVDMPDPVADGGRVTFEADASQESTIEEAHAACQRYAPGAGGGQVQVDPEELEAMRAYAQCMRDNGVPDFPDPNPDGGSLVRVGGQDGLDPDAVEAAEEACHDLRPEPGGKSAGGGA